jgi:hypothetical protein
MIGESHRRDYHERELPQLVVLRRHRRCDEPQDLPLIEQVRAASSLSRELLANAEIVRHFDYLLNFRQRNLRRLGQLESKNRLVESHAELVGLLQKEAAGWSRRTAAGKRFGAVEQ